MTPTHLSRAKEILVKLMNEADHSHWDTEYYDDSCPELVIDYIVEIEIWTRLGAEGNEPEHCEQRRLMLNGLRYVTEHGEPEEATADELSALEKEVNEMW